MIIRELQGVSRELVLTNTLRVASCEFRDVSCELPVASCQLPVASCQLLVGFPSYEFILFFCSNLRF